MAPIATFATSAVSVRGISYQILPAIGTTETVTIAATAIRKLNDFTVFPPCVCFVFRYYTETLQKV